MLRLAFTCVLGSAFIVIAACGGSGAGDDDAYGERGAKLATGNAVTVEMRDLRFVPQGIRVKPGTTVTWVNRDVALHNVSSIDSIFLSTSQGDMAQGDTFTYTFDRPGTYRYQCTFHHPTMNGVVIVEE